MTLHNRPLLMTGFQRYREINLNAAESTHAVKVRKLFREGTFHRSRQIPVVVHVIDFALEAESNGASARSTKRKFFAANDQYLMHSTMLIEMFDQINAACWSKLPGLAHYTLGIPVGHRTSTSSN